MSISKFAHGSFEEALAQLPAGLQTSTDLTSPVSAEDALAQLLAELYPCTGTTILRLPVVLHERGDLGRSTHYQNIKEGLFTSPVSIGARAVGWPSREVAVLHAARIAGKSNDEIRDLVLKLHTARKGVR